MKRDSGVSVVLFTGGRGSSVLSEDLIKRPDVHLTLAINGYDDGLSTGEVRRFLGDSLGPSDFRKNASHLARLLGSCPAEVIELLDVRLAGAAALDDAYHRLRARVSGPVADRIDERLHWFGRELTSSGKAFEFSDCSIGNIVFAGCFLRAARTFNAAVDDYCSLLGLPVGLIENVSGGRNAYLVAIGRNGELLASEADIVDAKRANRIRDIYLLDRPLTPDDCSAIAQMQPEAMARELESRVRTIPMNERLRERIAEADLIVYSPGTQHSSLFPSYLTHGLSDAIAGNLGAIKLLVTNIQTDAEITGANALEIIEKAVYYLREKGQAPAPVPALITHYVINDPQGRDEVPYVPLGRLESIEDPRLVRIANYEDGITGRHDASRVLGPFIASLLPRRRQRLAVWLYGAGTANHVAQTLLEMVRAGLPSLPLVVSVFLGEPIELDAAFVSSLPFPVESPNMTNGVPGDVFDPARFDYVALFESSGMYNGEDLVSTAGSLASGRVDAVWGSRRLSMKDIDASIKLQYRGSPWQQFVSRFGSYVLSVVYLILYGRYVSDTLSGVRALRVGYCANGITPSDPLLNHRLLSTLLASRAQLLETPVQFIPMSPEKVRRTTIGEGLRSLAFIVAQRWRFWREADVSSVPPPQPAPQLSSGAAVVPRERERGTSRMERSA
jgi:2-phospho-L-lactate transferase/gluconeogenesis factor (CofD/UPF0052 family)